MLHSAHIITKEKKMLRDKLKEELKAAMIAKNEARTGTIRLILAAIKDKDIASRTEENREGISDESILSLFTSMIKQRNDSIEMYKKGNRQDLADKEQAEIDIIREFMPKQMSADEVATAIKSAIAATDAASIKDMGKVMGELKAKYAGQMDFSTASATVKQMLSGS